MVSGIHHLTAITRKVQANVDFYAGFLGLRLVKRTGGFEDAEQLHLFYGDSAGSPGSLLTFLVWEDGSPGRVGLSQVSEIALAVSPASIGNWITRALRFGIASSGPTRAFGETVLTLKDPDGIAVKLVGVDLQPHAEPFDAPDIAAEDRIRRVRGATLLTDAPDVAAAMITGDFGFRPVASEGVIRRLVSSSGDVIDLRDATGFWPGVPGTGVLDHIAFRTPDVATLEAIETKLQREQTSPTNSHDRKYFHSLYVREPGGILFEVATDGPGMGIDESPQTLGSRLFIPGRSGERAADFEALLPQFALPGEDRVRYRDLPFIHRFHVPASPDGSTLMLLHGSGGSEADLMPLARRIAPDATLIGLRGRSIEDQSVRWFRRPVDGVFDQADIAAEAEAFAAFVEMALEGYDIDPARLTFLGYSNGANFLASAMMLYPGLVDRALLLRPLLVLEEQMRAGLQSTSLAGSRVALLPGLTDDLVPATGGPGAILAAAGAEVQETPVEAGHALSPADIAAGRAALAFLTGN